MEASSISTYFSRIWNISTFALILLIRCKLARQQDTDLQKKSSSMDEVEGKCMVEEEDGNGLLLLVDADGRWIAALAIGIEVIGDGLATADVSGVRICISRLGCFNGIIGGSSSK